MNKVRANENFQSALAEHLRAFMAEKRAGGCKYVTSAVYLRDLDRFLASEQAPPDRLTRELVDQWTTKRPNERPNTHFNRVCIIRQFALYLCRLGLEAYPPRARLAKSDPYGFVPRIFTHEEIARMFELLDHCRPFKHLPLRHLVLPEFFRTLYGCGLRVGEAMDLTVGDVNLEQGVLTICAGKFDKDRLVPLAPGLKQRLRRYHERLGRRPAQEPFFLGADRRRLTHQTVYKVFRELLWEMKIPHRGGGQGPRIHDLRHTFAVHRLLQWYREGADLNASLASLSIYLGHRGMEGTQRYLHLCAELMPEITDRLTAAFGDVIPGGDPS